MMRKKLHFVLTLLVLSLALALPISAQPVNPADVIATHFEAIFELLNEVFSSEENNTPENTEGNDDEVGIIVDPYG